MMDKGNENWKKLSVFVTNLEEKLRTLFKDRWKSLHGEEWNEGENESCDEKVEVLIGLLGLEIIKTINAAQMRALNCGKVSQWDFSTLSKILQIVKCASDVQHKSENEIIQSLVVEIRDNIVPRHPDKIVSNDEYTIYSSKLERLALQLENNGLDPNDSTEVEKDKNKNSTSNNVNTPTTETSDVNQTPQEYFELFEKLKSMSVRQHGSSSRSTLDSCKIDLEELLTAIKDGSKFATDLYHAMIHNYKALKTFEDKPIERVTEQEWHTIISEFGQAFEITEYFLKHPVDDTHFKVTILNCVRNILLKNESCDLDKWARIYYVSLNVNSHVELLEFLTLAIKKYPQVVRFYDLKLSMYSHMGNFKTVYDECKKYLKLFPRNLNLLFFKADALKHLILKSRQDKVNETIRAFEEFILEAGPGHPKTPEAYYCIGLVHMDLEVVGRGNCSSYKLIKTEEFYNKGVEAEKGQMSMFLPYQSSSKEMVTIVTKFNSNTMSTDAQDKDQTQNESGEVKRDLRYLSNPKRINLIKRARNYAELCRMAEEVAKMEIGEGDTSTSTSTSNSSEMNNFLTTFPVSPQAPRTPTGLKEIYLSDMDPTKDMFYEGTMLNLTVIDDPNLHEAFFTKTSIVDVVVQDDRFDAQLLSIFHFKSSSSREEVVKYFGFGCKFTLLHPYMSLDDVDRPSLRVDARFNLIVFKNNEDVASKKLCHYCSAEDSKSKCGKCGNNYCSRVCQSNDWKILKHKLICGRI